MKILILLLCLIVVALNRNDQYIRLMFDATEKLMTGNERYDPEFYDKLIETFDDEMLKEQNLMWRSFILLYDTNGFIINDTWGDCDNPQ